MSAGGRRRQDTNIGPGARVDDGGRVTFAPDSAPGRTVITAEEFFHVSQDSMDGRSGGGGGGGDETARGPPPDYAQGPRPEQRPGPLRRPQRPRPSQAQALPRSSAASPKQEAPPAPLFAVPDRQRSGRRVVAEEPAYLFTEEFPFTTALNDRTEEKNLGLTTTDDDLKAKKELPQMDEESGRQIHLSKGTATSLDSLDKLCTKRHLHAIKDSVVTHKALESFIFMKDEEAEETLELAGLENAPGVYNEVTQGCRLVFTNQKRLIFTQAKHSAEIGMPQMYGLASLFTCLHDQWTRRKWTSYYAVLTASQVLQVFVQQTHVTSYHESKCRCNDILTQFCCPMGGNMYSEKNITGVTQTLGDHDPHGLMSRWDHTRFVRHALVIRYLDCASNQVLETTAFAHPDTPAATLFEMARSIEANITTRATDLLGNKTVPTALLPRAFVNTPPGLPLYKQSSYRGILFVLFVIALIFFAFSTTSAVLMLFAVFFSFGGSYLGGNASRQLTPKKASWVPALLSKVWPKFVILGSSGVSLLVYLSAFLSGFQSMTVSASTPDTAFAAGG